ncbi:hypothetical protein TIFTF001_028104 [Ficus carica]|uniref:Uncharacterized protein n=1 Tax=Ficus carica TaxID=3494 RepID=A0AA88DQE3_FICCA|nr:hypothetical protein TIFTF001_028104 [Ficus carica]
MLRGKKQRLSFAELPCFHRHEVQWPWSEIWRNKSATQASKSAGDSWKNHLGLMIREAGDKARDLWAWKMQHIDNVP